MIQTRHTDGLNISHIIILEHTAVSASKHWAPIKQAVRQSFNGADLMWPILSQSERHNTHDNAHQSLSSGMWRGKLDFIVCVCMRNRRIRAVCICWQPHYGCGFVCNLGGLCCVWVCVWGGQVDLKIFLHVFTVCALQWILPCLCE